MSSCSPPPPNGGSSTVPSSNLYRGPAPFSEPETNAIETFARPDLFERDTWNRQVEDLDALIAALEILVENGKPETFVFAGGYPLAAVFAALQSRGTFAGMTVEEERGVERVDLHAPRARWYHD